MLLSGSIVSLTLQHKVLMTKGENLTINVLTPTEFVSPPIQAGVLTPTKLVFGGTSRITMYVRLRECMSSLCAVRESKRERVRE